MSKDQRRFERRPMFRVCRYIIDGREYADLSTNISERGIFIKNFSPPPIGTPVSLTVTLPDEWGKLPMKLNGRVAWVNESDDPHLRGMGIAFTSVQADSLPIIEYFVREVYEQDDLQGPKLTTHDQSIDSDEPAFEYELDIEVEEPS